MKTATSFLLFTLTLASGWGQTGQTGVDFRNGDVTFPNEADRWVYRDHVGGERLGSGPARTGYAAGLWFTPGPVLTAVDCRIAPERGRRTGVDCPMRSGFGPLVGSWAIPLGVSALMPLDGVEPGGLAALQVRVWDRTKFSSFQSALEAGEYGVSEPFAYTVPFPGAPDLEFRMENLRAFAVPYPPGTNGTNITINDIQVTEGSTGVFHAEFTLKLSEAHLFPVSVDFRTVDLWVVGKDYVPTSGTLTFAPGETVKTVSVELIPDALYEPLESFMLSLSNPINCFLSKTNGVCLIRNFLEVDVSFRAQVRFNTAVDHHYAVEWSVNLRDWQPVLNATNVPGTGGTVAIIDQGVGCQSLRTYRTRLLD